MASAQGLLALSEGLKGALQGYKTEREYADKKAREAKEDQMKEDTLQATFLKEGFTKDPKGLLVKTPEQQAKESTASQLALLGKPDEYSYFETDPTTGKVVRKQTELGTKKLGLMESEIKKNEAEAKNKLQKTGRDFELLPKENQIQIQELAKSTGNQTVIANQLKADMERLNDPKISDDQKLAHAKSMIKTLNSRNGQDAVGAEEAKRLASLLEYHIFNFTQPGPVMGRAPISEFQKQVQNTIDSLVSSSQANQQRIDQLSGRDSLVTRAAKPAQDNYDKMSDEELRRLYNQKMSASAKR